MHCVIRIDISILGYNFVTLVDMLRGLFVTPSKTWVKRRAIKPGIVIDRSPLLPISSTMSYTVFCMGNPLLDLQVTGGEKLLEKYELKANDAVLAGDKHAGMFVPCALVKAFRGPDWIIAMMKS